MTPTPAPKKHQPFVPESMQMTEMTGRAVAIGLILCVVLGAANAYLGLRAGLTIAATYPAAVIGMAALRLFKGSILEENICRTAGSIGESVAAGAIFTIPAFIVSRAWTSFTGFEAYWKSTALMMVGSIVGVLFVSLVRRVMVEDPDLPFPESVAAAEIHKAGARGAQAVKFLFYNIVIGGVVYIAGQFRLFAAAKIITGIRVGALGLTRVRLNSAGGDPSIATGGMTSVAAPDIAPALLGVGFIIGPRLAALQFAGGLFAWGLLVPLLVFFLGPQLASQYTTGGATDWTGMAAALWRYIVRPIAVGTMIVGAAYTLFKMRKNLSAGLARAIAEIKSPPAEETLSRTEKYMSSKVVLSLIGVMFFVMIGLYQYIAGNTVAAIVAAVVMIFVGFFFATVSGSLVGFIGSSNNPISGLTLSTLIIAALLMVSLGFTGAQGVAVVLGVAAVVCVSSAVAGELLQDFKVGYILGGTPRNIQIVELIAVLLASAVMYFPLWVLHEGNIRQGGVGFGGPQLPAPQAGLMAMLAQGIVGGDMAWPLVVTGMLLGIAAIMIEVRSPMLFAVGMYLPFGTTATIFVGGVAKWLAEIVVRRNNYNDAQRARIENAGVLAASGLIAGEALMGLVWSGMQFLPPRLIPDIGGTSYLLGFAVLMGLVVLLIRLPLTNAGSPDEPAPPAALM
jgi:putative OPT family oligopeptide transporter